MNITSTIKYIGVQDTTIDLFEGQYEVLPTQCDGHTILRGLPEYQRIPGHTGRPFANTIHSGDTPDKVRTGEFAFQGHEFFGSVEMESRIQKVLQRYDRRFVRFDVYAPDRSDPLGVDPLRIQCGDDEVL